MKARTKMCEKFEGWTNHETWATNLWIDNTYGLYITAQGLAKESESIYDLSGSSEICAYYGGNLTECK